MGWFHSNCPDKYIVIVMQIITSSIGEESATLAALQCFLPRVTAQIVNDYIDKVVITRTIAPFHCNDQKCFLCHREDATVEAKHSIRFNRQSRDIYRIRTCGNNLGVCDARLATTKVYLSKPCKTRRRQFFEKTGKMNITVHCCGSSAKLYRVFLFCKSRGQVLPIIQRWLVLCWDHYDLIQPLLRKLPRELCECRTGYCGGKRNTLRFMGLE